VVEELKWHLVLDQQVAILVQALDLLHPLVVDQQVPKHLLALLVSSMIIVTRVET
jgi:hypothetical protein